MEQMRPSSPEQAPDPATNYERAQPQKEAGQGRMENNTSTPTNAPDRMNQAAKNAQAPRQINAHDTDDRQKTMPEQPDHSMHDEEPLGWDQAPTDIHDPTQQRHPRTEGKGGTP